MARRRRWHSEREATQQSMVERGRVLDPERSDTPVVLLVRFPEDSRGLGDGEWSQQALRWVGGRRRRCHAIKATLPLETLVGAA
jgi:hypothetical protein